MKIQVGGLPPELATGHKVCADHNRFRELLLHWGVASNALEEIAVVITFPEYQLMSHYTGRKYIGEYTGIFDNKHYIYLDPYVLVEKEPTRLNPAMIHELRHLYWNIKKLPYYFPRAYLRIGEKPYGNWGDYNCFFFGLKKRREEDDCKRAAAEFSKQFTLLWHTPLGNL